MKKLIILFLTVYHISVLAAPPIYIGIDADMSAVARVGGEAIFRGASIAVDEINAKGGVLGRPIEIIVKDHRGNPARGIANMEKLAMQKDLVAVLGGVHTPVALKELETIHEHKLIYLVPWAAGTPIIDNGFTPNYVFRISIRDEQAASVLIQHAKKLKIDKIGLLLESTGWGRSNQKSLTLAANQAGIEVSQIEWFNWGQKDFSHQTNSLISNKSQGIVLVANAPEGATAVMSILAHPKAKNLPLLSHWGIAGGEFVNRIGLDNVEKLNLVVLQTYSFSKPHNPTLNESVLSAYASKYVNNIKPHQIPGAVGVAHAYDLVHVLALAIKQAGSINREQVRSELENIKEYKGLVKDYSRPFTKDRHDALWAKDYILSTFDQSGYLAPN